MSTSLVTNYQSLHWTSKKAAPPAPSPSKNIMIFGEPRPPSQSDVICLWSLNGLILPEIACSGKLLWAQKGLKTTRFKLKGYFLPSHLSWERLQQIEIRFDFLKKCHNFNESCCGPFFTRKTEVENQDRKRSQHCLLDFLRFGWSYFLQTTISQKTRGGAYSGESRMLITYIRPLKVQCHEFKMCRKLINHSTVKNENDLTYNEMMNCFLSIRETGI